MKLPELPDINNDGNEEPIASGLPSLGDLDENNYQDLSDNVSKKSDNQADFEDSIEMPDLFSIDESLKPKEPEVSKDGFGDIPIGLLGGNEKLEPNRMFEDLPINAEFEEPQMFGDIPFANGKEVLPKENLANKVDKESDVSPEMPDLVFDFETESASKATPEVEYEPEPVVEDEYEADYNKQISDDKPSSLESNSEINYEKYQVDDEEIDEEAYLEEYVPDKEDVEGEFGFLPGIDLEEYNPDEEDIEDEFGFLPGIGLDENEIEDHEDIDSNEIDEEKIKEFFGNLKDKTSSFFNSLKGKIGSKKKEEDTKPEEKGIPKKRKVKKDSNKINESKGSKKDLAITTIKYLTIIALFVLIVFFAVSKLGVVGKGYNKPEEISQSVKVNKVNLDINNIVINEDKIGVSIENKSEDFLEFTVSAEIVIKDEEGKKEVSCNDTIMFISSEGSIEENLKCEGLPEHKDGNSYKIKFNAKEL